jgi:hypothetical protein
MEWKTADSAPKDGTDILVCLFGNTFAVVFWDDEGTSPTHHWQTADGITYHDDAPRLWMPIPATT